MRRTHASLSRKAGIDPKLVADQLGHGIGVNLDTYTIADLKQRLAAVHTSECSNVHCITGSRNLSCTTVELRIANNNSYVGQSPNSKADGKLQMNRKAASSYCSAPRRLKIAA